MMQKTCKMNWSTGICGKNLRMIGYRQHERITTSAITESKIYGREDERKQLIRMLKMSGNVSVLPIKGLGGIGKTALAQSVFNDKEIEDHFHHRTWVYVSEKFDRVSITREVLESVRNNEFICSTNLDSMERKLRKTLAGKKILLVLDDVWTDDLNSFISTMQSANAESVKIVVTTRDSLVLPKQLKLTGITLKGLKKKEYWSFFVKCVFGEEEDPANCPVTLQRIGEQIVEKLKGSPLAAKTIGRLLWKDTREEQWVRVLKSNLWELGTNADDIMPALALSYDHLPDHLQRCFAFCSMFPKDYMFTMQDVVYMWIAQGFVSSETPEDTGREYFNELLSRHFFHPCQDSPFFKFHSLAHDLARSVCSGEYCTYDLGDISHTVRHLWASGLNIELELRQKSLRSFVMEMKSESKFHLYNQNGLNGILNQNLAAFKRIRVLVLINCALDEFPDVFSDMKHLRYLDLYRTNIKSAPKSLFVLYHLKLLRLPNIDVLPDPFHKLINLRFFRVNTETMTRDTVHAYEIEFPVKKESGYKIAQLRDMNDLRGTLVIKKLENIDNKEDARNANLHKKCNIECLRLIWSNSGDGCESGIAEEVLEGLRPHSQLKKLYINGYMGVNSPSWFMTLQLKNLQTIEFYACKNWATLPPLGLLQFLTFLSLNAIDDITIEGDDQVVSPMFPFLKELELKEVSVTFRGMSSFSAGTGGCSYFPCLVHLRIVCCDRVSGLPWPMLSALQVLQIEDSEGLGDLLPGCLKYLTSLKHIDIKGQTCNTLQW
ncbi:P-loop containing nucleoside triphosphate hydrolase protein [Dioscorea alata]|uniref:P-loop containing nucleoside triphosphate hydrolase protein n=1 Tax=Dioscorea alata TaxID=55571 RepID=A0ACB7U8N1_DIOAL|nr:P-loop containing nucleoside triphosphate hydrolase protein [Dioscorea alata]